MKKTKVYEGKYTSINKIDCSDVFFDIASALMKGFQLEVDDKDTNINDLEYMINGKHRVLSIINDRTEQVLQLRMTECEKIACETLFEKEKMVKELGIDAATWDAVMENDRRLQNGTKTMIRTFQYRVEVAVMEDTEEGWKFAEIAKELLSNIQ